MKHGFMRIPSFSAVSSLKRVMEKFWYDYSKIMSYGALFNFIIGARGNGKTYGFKQFAIRKALDGKGQFMYLRRTEVEMKDACDTFFDDIQSEYPTKAFRFQKNKFQWNELDENGECLYNWETIGHAAYLSNARRKKSVSFDKVKYICFDEFIIPSQGMGKYLPDEVTSFLEFYETVARMRDVQVFFLSNALSTVNPYFMYFGLVIPRSQTGIKRINDDIVVELIHGDAYKEAKKQTRFGKLISGTQFEQYAVDNEFVEETQDYIEKKGAKAFYDFTIYIDDTPYGVYRDNTAGLIYVSKDVNFKFPFSFQYKTVGGRNSMVFRNRTRYAVINDFVLNFESGNVRFESQEIKQIFWQFFMKIL